MKVPYTNLCNYKITEWVVLLATIKIVVEPHNNRIHGDFIKMAYILQRSYRCRGGDMYSKSLEVAREITEEYVIRWADFFSTSYQ